MTSSLDAMRFQLSAAMSGSAPGLSAADALCATCVVLLEVDGAAVSVVFDGASTGTFGSSSVDSRRLDEYQFTFGEGPCLDAVASKKAVLVPDLDAPQEQRWPMLRGALLEDGIRGVFAVPIMLTSVCVGALDLFRTRPGPLEGDALEGARLAAELACAPLLELIDQSGPDDDGDQDGTADRYLGDMDRIEVYQATGMLIVELEVDAAEAMLRLRAHAMATGQTASEVARAIVARELMLDQDEPTEPGGTGRSTR